MLASVEPWRSQGFLARRPASTNGSKPTTRRRSGRSTSRSSRTSCGPGRGTCAPSSSEFGPFHLFRPHNDLRFSKNKPPYKTHQGAYGESEGGAGHYFQISALGLMCGTGYYSMANDQLDRFPNRGRRRATPAPRSRRSSPRSRSSGTPSARSTNSRPHPAGSRRTTLGSN